MIPADAISEWAATRPWPSRLAIEQDLIIARAIVAFYEHPLLGRELTLWGGSCLHQVHLPVPQRYTEDLDFVCHGEAGIATLFEAIGEVAGTLGMAGMPRRWRMGAQTAGVEHFAEHLRVTLRAPATDDPSRQLRIKIEINNEAAPPARPPGYRPFRVDSSWFTGQAKVLCYTSEELAATKLRGLVMRSKGRDLFDLWLALTELGIEPQEVIDCFAPWHPKGYSAAGAIADLEVKLGDPAFRADIGRLVGSWPAGYDIDAAGALVRDRILQWT